MSSLVIPLVIWGRKAPTHCISSILMTPNQNHIVTGCNDGYLCVWDVTDTDNWQVHPQTMLFGHSSAVTCLAMGSADTNTSYIVSSTDSGEMCLWDLSDGRCVESTKMSVVHTAVQAYQLLQCRDVRLVCNGYYPEIHVVHPRRLEILFSLCAQIQPDWISALCILRPVKREDDVVVAVTNSGMVKVWTISGAEPKPAPQIFEDESKQIRCLNAQMLRCCAYNQRTVLIICSKYWQIYDAGDFSLLCSESSRRGERWTGGEFIGIDRVIVWSNEGRGYLYRLPTNVNSESENYRKMADPSSPRQMGPQAYTVLDVYNDRPLECNPVMMYVLGRRGRESKLLLRGDSHGRMSVWMIPDVNDNKMKLVRQESFDTLPVAKPKCVTSLSEEWNKIDPPPEGIIDQLNVNKDGRILEVTATVYMPTKGELACGRDDGSIVIIPASVAIVLQLLDTTQSKDSLPHQILVGHSGRVNCLLYPFNDSARYDPAHLVSGGTDFSVFLWDIASGTKLHSFCVHGGEITQLIVPPENCNPRVLSSVCAVASDHSLSLLSLKERKCIMLASRQLFPIQTVKWRPHDDFIIIGCTDGTVYVWQMETGHLDRVVHGLTAEDILNACEEKQDFGEKLTNPTISIAQAFKRHNLATFRNLAEQQIKKAQDALEQKTFRTTHPSLVQRSQASSMMIQGLKTNIKDPDSHIIYFDTEALIVQLLSEEYMALSPNTLETLGFYTSIPQDPGLSDTQKKVVDFISKVKDKADDVSKKIQSKVETSGMKSSPRMSRRGDDGQVGDGSVNTKPVRPPPPNKIQVQEPPSATLVITQIFMSCLHAWGLDPEVDKLCLAKLGLLRPKKLMVFGFLSPGGQMSLLLPGWYNHLGPSNQQPMMTATIGHWQISSAVTTQHLLAVISVTNTLMSMSNATFIKSRQTKSALSQGGDDNGSESDLANQSQNKQGWSLLAALHCVLLPDLIGGMQFKPPQVEMLARRWQDRCLEIREAAQALLLAELRRIGPDGRREVVEQWGPYLPSYVDPSMSLLSEHATVTTANVMTTSEQEDDDEDEDIFGGNENSASRVSQSYESRSKQATAIVMMGVVGAEFGAAIEGKIDDKKAVAEGFGLTNYSHARHTSKALTFLLLQPPSQSLPAYTLIRRAGVDLLGRGFTVWEPYLDVSAVLLGLLELCVDGDKLVPSMTFGLPLNQKADACRTARHALSLIATARPPAFVITMAKEVARHNALAQNNQSQHYHHQLHNSVLIRGKMEILRAIELLIDKIPNDLIDHLVEVMDVTVHCLDLNMTKNKELHKIIPALCSKFCTISYCPHSRRICVGAKSGSLAFYELKQGKCQLLPAHNGPVSAVAFSPDGKVLASFSYNDNRLLMWQTASSSLFNIGSHQTKCLKSFNTPAVEMPSSPNPLKLVKLLWIDSRTVLLRCHDGSESRYRV